MSLFGSILSLQDAINRLPQFEHQINRLTSDERNSRNRGSLRKNFVRQCQELHRQIDDHRKRTENARTDEVYKKENALEQIDRLKERLSELCPEKEQVTASTASDSEEEKPKVSPATATGSGAGPGTRRKSMMYDGDDSDEDSDNGTEIIETDVHLDEPSVAAPPQPKPRQPIAITRPPEPQTSLQREIAEAARLQNPVKNGSPEVMEPVMVRGSTFMAISNFEPTEQGDLALRKGRLYRITQTRSDGWWTALDEHGKMGLVPKTFLKHVQDKPRMVQSKVSNRLGVRDSVIGITTTTVPRGIGGGIGMMEERSTVQQRVCLGEEFDHDPHLSLACHLAPRLSTSNIGFHDLFWSHDKDQVFKRTVHVSKIVRLVRFEKMAPVDMDKKALVRMALVDATNPKAPQIVSNVHTITPRVKDQTWYFEKKENRTQSCIEFSDVVLRSNYSSPAVVLVVEASVVGETPSLTEKSMGHTYLRLIVDDKAVPSRTNVLYLDDEVMTKMKLPDATKKRVLLQVMDVPKDKAPFVDSLPDVIVSNLLYLPFLHFYRRRAGSILIRDNKNPLNAEYISDPLLSVFPHVCDQHDVMDEMLKIWSTKKKLLSKKSEVEQATEFFQTFIHTAFFLHGSQLLIEYDVKDNSCLAIRREVIKQFVDALRSGTLRKFIANGKFKPINILDYSLDLLGPHSID